MVAGDSERDHTLELYGRQAHRKNPEVKSLWGHHTLMIPRSDQLREAALLAMSDFASGGEGTQVTLVVPDSPELDGWNL